jgi:hypothetical protein
LRQKEDAPIKFSVTGTGRVGGLLELKIKKKNRKNIAPARGRGGQLELRIKKIK